MVSLPCTVVQFDYPNGYHFDKNIGFVSLKGQNRFLVSKVHSLVHLICKINQFFWHFWENDGNSWKAHLNSISNFCFWNLYLEHWVARQKAFYCTYWKWKIVDWRLPFENVRRWFVRGSVSLISIFQYSNFPVDFDDQPNL